MQSHLLYFYVFPLILMVHLLMLMLMLILHLGFIHIDDFRLAAPSMQSTFSSLEEHSVLLTGGGAQSPPH